jgi:broad specificity phosphatase PhoE
MVTRSGAAYPEVVSDLHCPATLLVAADGDDQVAALATSLRDRRVARVYTSTSTRAMRAGRLAAEVLGADAVALVELQEPSVAEEALDRCREALQAIADQHRGETVLVIAHGSLLSVLPQLSGSASGDLAARRSLPDPAVAEVSVDGDGFVVRWPGVADHTTV